MRESVVPHTWALQLCSSMLLSYFSYLVEIMDKEEKHALV